MIMTLREQFKKETGKFVIGYQEGESYYNPEYVLWLESKIESVTNRNGLKCPCPFQGHIMECDKCDFLTTTNNKEVNNG